MRIARLYQCPARRGDMDTFLQVDLWGFLQDNYTCPELGHILMTTLHCEVSGGVPTFQRRHGVDNPKFSSLLQSQTNVGWSQIFQGRLAQNWSRLQDECLVNNNDEFKLDHRYWTGEIWTRKLISLLWFTMRAQWDLRNADRHGRTKAANHAIQHAWVLKSITDLHLIAPHMLAADRDILAEPLQDKLQQHPSRLELWLTHTRAIINHSKADATAMLHRTHERLTHYFQYRRKKKITAMSSQPVAPRPTNITPNTNETDSANPG
jgi:hypothetical protein